MTEQERLIIALTQIDNIARLTEENKWKSHIYNHLSPIKYELERQLSNLKNNES